MYTLQPSREAFLGLQCADASDCLSGVSPFLFFCRLNSNLDDID